MENVDHKVDVQVELELFSDEITAEHLLRNKHLPGLEELVLLPTVKRRTERAQKSLRIIV